MKTQKSRSVKWGMTALILFAFMVQMMAPFSARADSPARAEGPAESERSASIYPEDADAPGKIMPDSEMIAKGFPDRERGVNVSILHQLIENKTIRVDASGHLKMPGKVIYQKVHGKEVPVSYEEAINPLVNQKLSVRVKDAPEKKTQSTSFISPLVSFLTNLVSLQTRAHAAGHPNPYVELYRNHVQYNQDITSVFRVTYNGKKSYALCASHADATPLDGTPYGRPSKDNRQNIIDTLYYGWNGAGTILGSKSVYNNKAIVATSLLLSYYVTGYTGWHNNNVKDNDYYWKLKNKVESTDAPHHNVAFSDSSLSTYVKGNKQVSQTTTFKADSRNRYTFSLPAGMTFVNESTGQRVTASNKSRNVTVKGGNRFHFEASLTYNKSYQSGNHAGSVPVYQPYMVKSSWRGYQPLMYQGRLDPPDKAGFSVRFYTRQKNLTVNYINSYNNYTMWRTEDQVVIGHSYDKSHYPNNFTKNGANGEPHIFKYNHYNGHGYGLKGTMPARDVTLDIYYDPYENVDVTYKNQKPRYDVFEHWTDLKKVGGPYSYEAPKTLSRFGNNYDLVSNKIWKGNVPYKDINHTFEYLLRGQVTVHYIDDRTGHSIVPDKTYSVHEGDQYEEHYLNPKDFNKYLESLDPENVKHVDRNYTYVGIKDGSDSEKGKIGWSDIEITYLYHAPLANVSLKSMQIYTRPYHDGLPVDVRLDRDVHNGNAYHDEQQYGDDILKKGTITVSLRQNGNKIDDQSYDAANLPSDLNFTVPASLLKKNSNASYTVKLEGYNEDGTDFVISPKAPGPNDGSKLTAQGYTAQEKTYSLDLSNKKRTEEASKTQYPGVTIKPVVRTSVSRGDASYAKQYETIDYQATLIPKMKTGYGFPASASFSYQNDLGTAYQTHGQTVAGPKLTFSTDKTLNDSHLESSVPGNPYSVSGQKVSVAMDQYQHSNQMSSQKTIRDAFRMPHIHVEAMTGHLFTDREVAAKDGRIKNELVDGHNEFYMPIWPTGSDGKRLAIPANGGLNYTAQYQTNPLGVNKVTVTIKDHINIYAYMYLTADSKTQSNDALHVQPIDPKKPFQTHMPEGWSKDDTAWLKKAE